MPTLSISPIPIFNVRVFLIQVDNQVILVDAGIPFTEGRLYQGLRQRGVDPSQIQTILLTHGHLDHIGCLANLKKLSSAVVVCHQSFKERLAAGGYEKAVPRRGPWKVVHKPVSAFLGSGIKPVQAEITVNEKMDLNELGIPGWMVHTPGHSPGSCSILLEGGICFLGDLIRETTPGVFDTGLFYHDREQILESLDKVASYHPEIIYLSHGTTLTGKRLEGVIKSLIREKTEDR